ncbi:MAG: group II intron reverse transcriptase/maturase [Candidatus Thermoplasmatota archaeon]
MTGVGGAHSTVETGESRRREGALVQGALEGDEGREIGVSLETPEKVRKLQRALYIKAKQEPEYRFYSLYDKVYRWDVLLHAWKQCRANRGSPGVDGVTFEDIEAAGVEEWLKALQEEMQAGRYRPSPVRRVLIPKPGGVGQRPLGIPTIRDRVCQAAAKLVLEPIFEADFDEAAYGYRPRRSAVDAVERVHDALRSGKTQVVDADLSKYFDTIPHAQLMTCLARRIVDRRMLRLVKMWLKAPVEEKDERGRKRLTGGKASTQGTPQGGVVSPLLANIYMHRFIKAFRKYRLAERHGAELVTYADDFVVLCRVNAPQVHDQIDRWMTRIGLRLNAEKTCVRNAWGASFNFLGYTFGRQYTAGTGRRHLGATPSKKAMKRFRESIRDVLRHGRIDPLPEVVAALNRRIRGWGAYFSFGKVSPVRRALDCYVTERLRSFLRRRHKVRSRGTCRFSKDWMYQKLGLLPMSALPRRQSAKAST